MFALYTDLYFDDVGDFDKCDDFDELCPYDASEYISSRFADEYPELGKDEIYKLVEKFFNIADSQQTQDFILSNFGFTIAENPAVLFDILLWMDFGRGEFWQGRTPVMDGIREIDTDDLRWDDWIQFDEIGAISSIASKAHCPARILVFGNDTKTMKYYGYLPNPTLSNHNIYGMDAINHITVGQTNLDRTGVELFDSVELFTNNQRVNDAGYLDRTSCNILISESGIAYSLVPIQYPAWFIGDGNYYDYDITSDKSISIPVAPNGRKYSNQSISIEVASNYDDGMLDVQEAVLVNTCKALLPYAHRPLPYGIVVSADEVSRSTVGLSPSFHWEMLGDLAETELPKIDDFHTVLYRYDADNPCEDTGIALLRLKLRAYGMPVDVGDGYTAYDENLASYASAFKAKVLGRTAPELCENSDKERNMDWYYAAEQALDHILISRGIMQS